MGWGKNEWITVAIEGIVEPGWITSSMWISGIAVPWNTNVTHAGSLQGTCCNPFTCQSFG